jgi:hypothetical protein
MTAAPDAAIAAQIVDELIAQNLIDPRYAALLTRNFARGEFGAADWLALATGALPVPPAAADSLTEDA